MKPNSKAISSKVRSDEEIEQLRQQYAHIPCEDDIKGFKDFPLSLKTLKGLADSKFAKPTDVQRTSIGPALNGKDISASAITGSGKTLAFLIPVLEHLFINKWSRADGIGAIIISPTRELAYQIFETLKNVGKYHDFSAGLVIGGKNLKFERSRMDQCNIMICTPGRLLQHMDENPLFNASTMEVLVLDEADRCLDMGFEKTLDAILENFPPARQTLLFSATQTNSVKDLARLQLRDPVYIGHKKELTLTAVPELLQQHYVVIALEDKITMLWSFIKNHPKQKIIVFFSSCKQVKYIYEIFCKLRPGSSLLALYGTLHQDRRIAIYNDFVKKRNVVLFATDVASRGLDFPAVNWVLQIDCPEDVTQYIHRAGRSARNKTRGESLLVLTPSEETAMIEDLNKQFINIQKIQIDPKKLFSPRMKIEAFLAQNPELKASAQRCFIAYIKSVFLMKNKRVFDVLKLQFESFAKSLGLIVTPRVRFLERALKKTDENLSNDVDQSPRDSRNDFQICDYESEDDFIKVKRVDHEILDLEQNINEEQPIFPKLGKSITKVALAKKFIKKKLEINEKRKFDEDGCEIVNRRSQMQALKENKYDEKINSTSGIDIEVSKKLISEEDKFDKESFRKLVKKRHKIVKDKLKDSAKSRIESGVGIEVDNDEDSVDLSWLPDPQDHSVVKSKFESKRKNSDDLSSNNEDYVEMKTSKVEFEPPNKKLKGTAKLSLIDAETIAAQLLANTM